MLFNLGFLFVILVTSVWMRRIAVGYYKGGEAKKFELCNDIAFCLGMLINPVSCFVFIILSTTWLWTIVFSIILALYAIVWILHLCDDGMDILMFS